MALIHGSQRNDGIHAETLRAARVDPSLLHPIQHRRAEAQAALQTIRSRAALVKSRTGLINHVRGAAKSEGVRLPVCSTRSFPAKVRVLIAGNGLMGLYGVLLAIAQLNRQIARYDRAIVQLAEQSAAAVQVQQVPGVGPLTALAYVLTIDDPQRFGRSRTVGVRTWG